MYAGRGRNTIDSLPLAAPPGVARCRVQAAFPREITLDTIALLSRLEAHTLTFAARRTQLGRVDGRDTTEDLAHAAVETSQLTIVALGRVLALQLYG